MDHGAPLDVQGAMDHVEPMDLSPAMDVGAPMDAALPFEEPAAFDHTPPPSEPRATSGLPMIDIGEGDLPPVETAMPSAVPYEETTSPFGTGAALHATEDLPPLETADDITAAASTTGATFDETVSEAPAPAPAPEPRAHDATEELLFGDVDFSSPPSVAPLEGLETPESMEATVAPIAGLRPSDSLFEISEIEVPEPPVLAMPTAVEPPAAIEPPAAFEPMDAIEPLAGIEPMAVLEPAAAAEPMVAFEPPAALEPPAAIEPPAASEPPSTAVEPSVVVEPPAEIDLAPPIPEPVAEAHAPEVPAPRPAFVTETMAELYVKQGFTAQAIAVYRQLVAQRPHDVALAARLAALEAPAAPVAPAGVSARTFFASFAVRPAMPTGSIAVVPAAAPPADTSVATAAVATAAAAEAAARASAPTPVISPAITPLVSVPVPASHVTPGGTLDQLFGNVAPSDDEERIAQAYAAIGDAVEPMAPVIKGKPTQPAASELSLDSVFRDSKPQLTPTGTQKPFTRQSQMLRFDQFFTPAEEDQPPVPPAPPAGEPGSAGDIAQFSDWLQGLKDK
ncbi:MAG: hypothetical protein HYR75_04740, partial [Gemmatimonadetes bacterium]|nr:hypothetical protein [Gemmatimonadota bacterium]